MGKRLAKAGVVAVLLSLMWACTPPEPKPKPEAAPEPVPVVMTAPPEPDPLEQRGKRLAKQLLDPDVAKRVAAAGELGLMAEAGELTDGPLQQLINVLEQDQTPEVQDAVTLALGKSCHPAAMEILVRTLRREPAQVRVLALSVLGVIGDFKTAEKMDAFLLRIEKDKSPEAESLRRQGEASRKQIMLRGGRREECLNGLVRPPEEHKTEEAAEAVNETAPPERGVIRQNGLQAVTP
jgi:hypothetical protein